LPSITGWRINCGLERELARAQACQLQLFDGRRVAPDRKRMTIRRPDGAARSVRAIDAGQARCKASPAPAGSAFILS